MQNSRKARESCSLSGNQTFILPSSCHVHTALCNYIYIYYITVRNLWAHILGSIFRARNTCGPHREVYVFNIRIENSSNVQGNHNLEKRQRLVHFSGQMGPTTPNGEGTPVRFKNS